MAGFLQRYFTVYYAVPMTSVVRAALTTSSVMKIRPVIFSIRSICTTQRLQRLLRLGDAAHEISYGAARIQEDRSHWWSRASRLHVEEIGGRAIKNDRQSPPEHAARPGIRRRRAGRAPAL